MAIISCLCGATRQTVYLKGPGGDPTRGGASGASADDTIALCHCYTCRHITGQLCASYLPIWGTPLATSGSGESLRLQGMQRYRVFGKRASCTSAGVVRMRETRTGAGTGIVDLEELAGKGGGSRQGKETTLNQLPEASYYFCAVCGCHIFRSFSCTPSTEHEAGSREDTQLESESCGQEEEVPCYAWEVATGAIVQEGDEGEFRDSQTGDHSREQVKVDAHSHGMIPLRWEHRNVKETRDGGLSVWLSSSSSSDSKGGTSGLGQREHGQGVTTVTTRNHSHGQVEAPRQLPEHGDGPDDTTRRNIETQVSTSMIPDSTGTPNTDQAHHASTDATDTVLKASCHCGRVSFSVTRPHPSISTAPRSNFPDLMYPYCSTPQEVISNPGNMKWWLCSPSPSSSSYSISSSSATSSGTGSWGRGQADGVSTGTVKGEDRVAAGKAEAAVEEEGKEEKGDSKATGERFPTHYLAGTCACRSCRLSSGFEIQCWAFIPRGNIFMHLSSSSPPALSSSPFESGSSIRGGAVSSRAASQRVENGDEEQADANTGEDSLKDRETEERVTLPLSFPDPNPNSSSIGVSQDSRSKEIGSGQLETQPLPLPLPMKSYESSPGVIREFCPVCGATVFWHDKWRPDLIDVSVGLFQFPGDHHVDISSSADESLKGGEKKATEDLGSGGSDPGSRRKGGQVDGARHESWLVWWRDRVSFAEDADRDRVGGCAAWGRGLIAELERGLKGI